MGMQQMLLGAGGPSDKLAWALNFGEVPTTDTYEGGMRSSVISSKGSSCGFNADRIVYSSYRDYYTGKSYVSGYSSWQIAPVTCIDWNGDKIWDIELTIDADYSNNTSSSSNSYCRCSSVDILSDNSVIAILHTDNLRLSSDRHRIFAVKISATGAVTSQKEVGYLREQTYFGMHMGETPFCKLVNGKLLLATGISKYSGSNHDKSGLNFAVLDTDLTMGGDRWKFRDDSTSSYKFIATKLNLTPGSEWFTSHVRTDGFTSSSHGVCDDTHIMGKVNSNGTIEMKRWFQRRAAQFYGMPVAAAASSDGTKLYMLNNRAPSLAYPTANKYKMCLQSYTLNSNTDIKGYNNNASYSNDTLNWSREFYDQTKTNVASTHTDSKLFGSMGSAGLRTGDNGLLAMVVHSSYIYVCATTDFIKTANTSNDLSYEKPVDIAVIMKLNESDGSVVWVRSLSSQWESVSSSTITGSTLISDFRVHDNGIVMMGVVKQNAHDTWKQSGNTNHDKYQRSMGFIARLPLDGSQTKSRTDSTPEYNASATEQTNWWWSDDRVVIDSSGTSTPGDIYYKCMGEGGYDIVEQSDDGNDLGIHVDTTSDEETWDDDQLSAYSSISRTISTKPFIFTELK